jgi:hypothetical protein
MNYSRTQSYLAVFTSPCQRYLEQYMYKSGWPTSVKRRKILMISTCLFVECLHPSILNEHHGVRVAANIADTIT